MEADMFAIRFLSEAGPDTSLSWLLWVVLGFFLVMVLVGWWASKNKGTQPEVPPEAHGHDDHEQDHH
jgi:hypothetical protein